MDNITLMAGGHMTREQGLCVMEAVAFFSGEAHSDAPQCACPVIAGFARRLNDRLDDAHRQLLTPLIPALALSRIGPEVGRKRRYLAADMAVRRWAPLALEARGFTSAAAALRACRPIVDKASAKKGADAADDAAAAYDADDAAAAAASAAAAAADAAAYADDAADDAAAAAADDAAYAAAYAAAAYAAAYAAAADARQDWLAAEGIRCLEAMLAIRE